MSRHLELNRRLSGIREIFHNMGDLVAYVGLESQIIIIEDNDDEIRSQWNSLSLEISDLSNSINVILRKMSMAAENNRTKLRIPIRGKQNEDSCYDKV